MILAIFTRMIYTETGLKPENKSATMEEELMYDYLIVGAGLYGAVFAREATDAGKKVLVVDKRPTVAGNVYTEDVEGIKVHVYGAHIFHTNNREVWEGLCKPLRDVQPVYQFSGGQLQGRTLQPAV